MPKKSLKDLKDLRGKRVLIRVDFNVPLDDAGNITNDRRIRAAIPTIKYVLDNGASAIVMSHLGRPTGDLQQDIVFKMDRVASRMLSLLMKEGDYGARLSGEVVGPLVDAQAKDLPPGVVLLIENLRFHPGEQAEEKAKKARKDGNEAKADKLLKHRDELASGLAKIADVYVNDAFGTCHRTDASMYAVPLAMEGKPRVVGFLVAKELDVLGKLLSNPEHPLIGIMGGAKVSDKIGFIKSMLSRVDKLLVGGAMTYTFMKALGQGVGSSRCEADKLDVAKELFDMAKGKIVLPSDHLIADKPEPTANTKIVEGPIPDGWFGMDIGPKTIKLYSYEIAKARTVVWNGPLGKCEDEPFSHGTRAVAAAMANANATTIVGGGETAEAVEELGLDTKMTHVSTGGGAFLEYVEGTPFKPLQVLDEQ
jgi:phosphoglycerate kinase